MLFIFRIDCKDIKNDNILAKIVSKDIKNVAKIVKIFHSSLFFQLQSFAGYSITNRPFLW